MDIAANGTTLKLDRTNLDSTIDSRIEDQHEVLSTAIKTERVEQSEEFELSDLPFQICTSFPNDNSKHIDFVIHMRDKTEKIIHLKENTDEIINEGGKFSVDEINAYFSKLEAREAMMKEIRQEGIEIYEYPPFEKGASTHRYILLNCPNERLLKEAEEIKLQVKLKNQMIGEDKNETLMGLRKFKNRIFHDKLNFVCTAQFDDDYRHLFDLNVNNPFRATIRTLLVENILLNVDFKMGEQPQIKDWKRFFSLNEEIRTEENKKLKKQVLLKNKGCLNY